MQKKKKIENKKEDSWLLFLVVFFENRNQVPKTHAYKITNDQWSAFDKRK